MLQSDPRSVENLTAINVVLYCKWKMTIVYKEISQPTWTRKAGIDVILRRGDFFPWMGYPAEHSYLVQKYANCVG
jgi:hypothetical protein